MSSPRQDFLLQPYTYLDSVGNEIIVWDFPLDDFYINGKIQPTPYGDSDDQHKIDIVVNNIGAIKQFPLLGFGLFQYLSSEVTSDVLYQKLTEQMKMDGYSVGIGAIQSGDNSNFEINYKLITPAY